MSGDLQIYAGYRDDELAIFEQFTDAAARAEPGFIVDFVGIRTRASSVYPAARTLENMLLGLPVPADFHAEAVEWIGVLKSVASARDRWVVMELGAGYGTWCVGSAVAARRRGLSAFRLYAVEGDEVHFSSLQEHLRDNGFDPAEHVLINAAVGAENGTARWPKVADANAIWGSRPVKEGEADYTGHAAEAYVVVRVVALSDLVAREPVWDLIHIDVQGHELEICRSCIGLLNERVRWIVVGTHSRKLDGDMLELLYRAGWMLENEKPTRFAFTPSHSNLEAMALFDGTQVWRNPRLA